MTLTLSRWLSRTSVASQVTALQAKLASVESSLLQLQAKENERVVFTASIRDSSVTAASGHIIPFTRVVTNIGNAYDANTSAFTAPFDGQYMVFVTVDVSSDYARLAVAKNGHNVLYGHNDAGDHHIYAGGAITQSQGDEITIIHGNDVVGSVDGGAEAIFSGFKI